LIHKIEGWNFMPSAGLILLSFNLLLVIAILLGFLGGVIKGLYKSVYLLRIFNCILCSGCFTNTVFEWSSVRLGFLGSLLAQAVPDAGVEASTIRIMLPDILAHLFTRASRFICCRFWDNGWWSMVLLNLALSLALLIVFISLKRQQYLNYSPFILWFNY